MTERILAAPQSSTTLYLAPLSSFAYAFRLLLLPFISPPRRPSACLVAKTTRSLKTKAWMGVSFVLALRGERPPVPLALPKPLSEDDIEACLRRVMLTEPTVDDAGKYGLSAVRPDEPKSAAWPERLGIVLKLRELDDLDDTVERGRKLPGVEAPESEDGPSERKDAGECRPARDMPAEQGCTVTSSVVSSRSLRWMRRSMPCASKRRSLRASDMPVGMPEILLEKSLRSPYSSSRTLTSCITRMMLSVALSRVRMSSWSG